MSRKVILILNPSDVQSARDAMRALGISISQMFWVEVPPRLQTPHKAFLKLEDPQGGLWLLKLYDAISGNFQINFGAVEAEDRQIIPKG